MPSSLARHLNGRATKIFRFRLGLTAASIACLAFYRTESLEYIRSFAEAATKPLPDGAPPPSPAGQTPPDPDLVEAYAKMSPAAAAWLRAARRTASARSDSSAHWEAAWEMTEAWWLRPVAFTLACLLCFGAILQDPRRFAARTARKYFVAPASLDSSRTSKSVDTRVPVLDVKEMKAAQALKALQRMELPFYATSATWSDRPLTGVIVSGNLRSNALEGWEESASILRERLEQEMGRKVVVHLLRRSDLDDDAQLAKNQQFELLVTDPASTELTDLGILMSVTSLAATLFLALQLGTDSKFQSFGSVIETGSSFPVIPLFAMLLLAEAARTACASSHDVSIGQRTFLPTPQVGMLGSFATPQSPAKSQTAALQVALAYPLTMLLTSLALLLAGHAIGFDSFVDLRTAASSTFAWPTALLPSHCNQLTWLGTQGILMAALALIPHSPDGKIAWSCLIGRKAAAKLGDAFCYIYPVLGLVAMWCFGPGYMALPLTWALILVNVSPDDAPPPLEEASEISPLLRISTQLLLLTAIVITLPFPLGQLMSL